MDGCHPFTPGPPVIKSRKSFQNERLSRYEHRRIGFVTSFACEIQNPPEKGIEKVLRKKKN